jgi:hypothetical protein
VLNGIVIRSYEMELTLKGDVIEKANLLCMIYNNAVDKWFYFSPKTCEYNISRRERSLRWSLLKKMKMAHDERLSMQALINRALAEIS